MWLKQLLVVLVAGTVVGVAEAKSRRIDPTVGRALGGLLNQMSNAQRESEMRANQEAARQQKLERERLESLRLQRLSEEQRLQRQLAEDRQRQLELEKQKLALDRQRWKEEADHDGWFVLGVHIPSWLWKSVAGSLAFAILWGLIKKPFSR